MKRATDVMTSDNCSLPYFNPRPREEDDYYIHNDSVRYDYISIHALVKRATLTIITVILTVINFNPRPRKEGDITGTTEKLCFGISIHALVKRATDKV